MVTRPRIHYAGGVVSKNTPQPSGASRRLAGPAGITCALELAANGKRVLILEGGDTEYLKQSQDLYLGTTLGDPYFDLSTARLRQIWREHWSLVRLVPSSRYR